MVKIDHLQYPKFRLGRCGATRRADAYLSECSLRVEYLLRRHACGDWGNIPDEDKAANDSAIGTEHHIMSAYNVCGTMIWVYTNQQTKMTLVSLSGEDP